MLHIAVLSVCSQAARSTSNWTPAVARRRTEEDRELVKNLGGGGGGGGVRFGGFERESHLSPALQSALRGPGGKEGGRKRERTSKSARRTTTTAGRWSWRGSERGRERGRGARGEGRNGLKNDTQLLLMFRLSASQATTPLDFFKPQTTTTTTATNCDQSRFSVRLGLLLQLRRGMSMYPRGVGSLRCNRWSRVWANDLTSGVFIPSCHEEKKNLPPFLHSLLIQTLRIPARFKN